MASLPPSNDWWHSPPRMTSQQQPPRSSPESRRVITEEISILLGTETIVVTLDSDTDVLSSGDAVFLVRGADNTRLYISGDDDVLLGEYKSPHAKKLALVMETMDEIDLAATVSHVSENDATYTIQINISLKFSNSSASQPELLQQARSKLSECLGARFHAASTDSPSSESLFGSPSPHARQLETSMAAMLQSISGGPSDRDYRLGQGASGATTGTAALRPLPASTVVINDKNKASTSNTDRAGRLTLLSSSKATAFTPVKQERKETLLGSSYLTIFGVNSNLDGIAVGDSVELMRDPESRQVASTVDVFNAEGDKVGYLRAEEAAQVTALIDQNPHILMHSTISDEVDDSLSMEVCYLYSKVNPSVQPSINSTYGTLMRMLGRLFQPAPGTECYAKKEHPSEAMVQSPTSSRRSSGSASQPIIEVFGFSILTMVGMRYHSGIKQVSAGDEVTLVREPDNKYDENVIGVKTLAGTMIGHISGDQAELLANVMDRYKPITYVAFIDDIQSKGGMPVQVQFATRRDSIPLYINLLKARLGRLFHEGNGDEDEDKADDGTAHPGSNDTSSSPASATHVFGESTLFVVLEGSDTSRGPISAGDKVELVRPDRRAQRCAGHLLRVDTVDRTALGHVYQRQAKKLVKIMDQHPHISYKASIKSTQPASCVVTVQYAAAHHQLAASRRMVQSKLKREFRAIRSTTTGSLAHGSPRLTRHVDWQAEREAIDKLFEKQSTTRLQNLPDYEMPALLSHLNLFDYQRQGIAWLIHQEKGSIPSYITESTAYGQTIWNCAITQSPMYEEPNAVRGGILADDMGLGKTLQTIALVLSNPPSEFETYPLPKKHGLDARTKPRTTLIVAPVSVLANWESQIHQHVNQRKKNRNLSVLMYHGPDRHKELSKVEKGKVDILLASYQTIASDMKKMLLSKTKSTEKVQNSDRDDEEDADSEYEKKRRPPKKPKTSLWIFDLRFHRLVLDEAHYIKNGKSKAFQAMCLLNADRKICLTGTIMLNGPSDIHSLLAFLQVPPFCQDGIFDQFITEPIKEHEEVGLDRLRAVLAFICLRRTKQTVMSTIELMPKTVEIRSIEFPEGSDHKMTYDALYETARAYFIDVLEEQEENREMEEKGGPSRFAELLGLILRIRQGCNHLCLIPADYRQRANELKDEIDEFATALGREEGFTLLGYLRGAHAEAEQGLVECAVCMGELEEKDSVILRKCKHIFCEPCLGQIDNHLCPFCRESYSPDDMVKKQMAETAAKRPPKVNAEAVVRDHERSPKISAVLEAIGEMQADEKAVIFSQWTTMLDIMAAEFRDLGMSFTRIDGSMSPQERVQAMEDFEAEDTDDVKAPRFILCSLLACGTGINLTRGNVVMMLDPWWNGAAENQAMDRVHRIGQVRPVRVLRFLMARSIEERLVTYTQASKEALGKGTIVKLTAAEKRKARMTAMMDLFQVDPSKLEREWK